MINVCQEYTSHCFSWSWQVTMLKTITGKAYVASSHIRFFRRILEAATILSASFNLSRDSLSGRRCVRWSEFRNVRHQPPCANARPEKKKGAITRLHEVYPREALHPNFSFFLFGKSIVACSAQPLFPRTFSGITCSRVPVTSGLAALIWK